MDAFYWIYPSYNSWSFSIFPSLLVDYNDDDQIKTIEFMWLFWGFGFQKQY